MSKKPEAKLDADSVLLPTYELLEVKADGADQFIIEGYASRFGVKDDGNDIVETGAFKKTLKSNSEDFVPFLYGHNQQGLPIGYFLDLKEDKVGLRYKARLLQECEAGRVIYALAKAGKKIATSIGYRTIQKRIEVPKNLGAEANEWSQGAIRHLIEIDLREISVVPIAMLKSALSDSVKSEEGEAEPASPIHALNHVADTLNTDIAMRRLVDALKT